MTIFTLRVHPSNRKSGNVCMSDAQWYAIENQIVKDNPIDVIHIRVSGNEELLHRIPAKYGPLFRELSNPYENYRKFSYKPALKQMQKDAEALGFVTQEEIAQHFGLHQSRVSILKDFGMLTVHHKKGRTEFYLKQQVLDLTFDPRFATYLENNYERNESAAS